MPLAPRDFAAPLLAEARGRQALRRAITVRRLCADGMYDAFVSRS